MDKRWAGWLALVVVVLLAVATLLAATEGLLRIFAPVHVVGIQSAYQYDPELGVRLAPNMHRLELTDHLEEIRTNALGTVNFQEGFDAYLALVFAVGDSYTQGTGNPSDTSYPFQLDLLLNQDAAGLYQRRYGVVNLGLAGFGTEQSLITLQRYAGLIGQPRYILYLGCENDWDDDIRLETGYRHSHIVAGSPHWGSFVGPMLWLSQLELGKRARIAINAVRNARPAREPNPATVDQAATVSVAERVWPTIERIHGLSLEWNAVLILGWANPGTDSYAWLQAKAAEQNIAFADWAPAMESVGQAMPDLPMENSHSGGHWRPWMNNVIARTYARAMGVWPCEASGACGSAVESQPEVLEPAQDR